MTRFGIAVYLLLLIVFSGMSVLTVASIDNPVLLWLEGCVDVVIVTGVFMYLRGFRRRWWRFILLPSVAGQVGLLVGLGEIVREDFLLTALILVPALYLNVRVCRGSRTSPMTVI